VGADGLIIEVHHQPDKALSDGIQSILPEQFAQLMDECSQIATVLHRSVPRGIHVEENTAASVR
jgi:3-deoxy-7-phosphoheptulonate synthase